MLDHAGRGAIEADETQRAHDALRAPARGEILLVAEAVLQREQRGAFVQQRRNDFVQRRVRRGLQRDEHEIARPDLRRRRAGTRVGSTIVSPRV